MGKGSAKADKPVRDAILAALESEVSVRRGGKAAKVAPAVEADDRAWAIYKKADSDAGDDCRDKLDAVDGIARGWSQKEIESNPPD